MANQITFKTGTGAPDDAGDGVLGEPLYDYNNHKLYISDDNAAVPKEVGSSTYLPLAGGALTGNLTTTHLIDGRDVAADGVTADAALPKAGGTMTGAINMSNYDLQSQGRITFNAGGTMSTFKDEDDMASDSATGVCSQQSIAAFVKTCPVIIQTYTHNYYSSSGSAYYIPWGGSSNESSSQSYTYWDDTVFNAPFDGKLTNLWLSNDYTGDVDPGTVACFLAVNGSLGAVMSGGFNDWEEQTPLNYACTQNNTFSQGDYLGVKIDPTVAPRMVAITSVWEFTQ